MSQKKKINLAMDHWSYWLKALSCPHCGGPLTSKAYSFTCSQGHHIDLSKKGTLFLLKKNHLTLYNREQFEARRRIIEGGFFDPVLTALDPLLLKTQENPTYLLDAGCGEGSLLTRLERLHPHFHCLGLDISKEAIDVASRGPVPPLFAAADLAHLPLQDGCIDVLMNFLSPANYKSFQRVLKEEGLMIKVIPGPHYLKEVKMALDPQAPSHDNQPVVDQFSERFSLYKRQRVHTEMVLPVDALDDLLTMTPLGWQAKDQDAHKLKEDYKGSITLDLEILTATCKESLQPNG